MAPHSGWCRYDLFPGPCELWDMSDLLLAECLLTYVQRRAQSEATEDPSEHLRDSLYNSLFGIVSHKLETRGTLETSNLHLFNSGRLYSLETAFGQKFGSVVELILLNWLSFPQGS